jgi:hypothetical protein
MTRALCKAVLLINLAFVLVSQAWASDSMGVPPAGNWNKVQSLPQGTSLAVEMEYGAVIRGDFIRLSEDFILLTVEAKEIAYPKIRVSQVLWERPGSRVKRAAIVGGAVFGIGFGLGCAGAASIMDKNSATASERVQIGGMMGGLFGGIAAGITAIPRPSPHQEVVYRAK